MQPSSTPQTGRGVRIAIVDSGVAPAHPHVGVVHGGVAFDDDGQSDDFGDRLGHGPAVAAAIREKAPAAELYAVRVFDRTLSTRIDRIVAAIRWAAAVGVDIVNLSLGTRNIHHWAILRDAVDQASASGVVVVAAWDPHDEAPWLPGGLPGVVPATVDWDCPRDRYRIVDVGGRRACMASGYPRTIPGVPPARNLKGLSFGVANVTGFVARALEGDPGLSASAVLDRLASPTRGA